MPFAFVLVAWGGALLAAELGAMSRARVLAVAFCAVSFNAYGGLTTIARALLLVPPVQARSTDAHARVGVLLERATTPDARIAMVAAGALAYYADRPAIDLLGKSDRHVALGPMHLRPAPSPRSRSRPAT